MRMFRSLVRFVIFVVVAIFVVVIVRRLGFAFAWMFLPGFLHVLLPFILLATFVGWFTVIIIVTIRRWFDLIVLFFPTEIDALLSLVVVILLTLVWLLLRLLIRFLVGFLVIFLSKGKP